MAQDMLKRLRWDNKQYQIYALVDSRDSTIRYIGMNDDAQYRLYQRLQCIGIGNREREHASSKESHLSRETAPQEDGLPVGSHVSSLWLKPRVFTMGASDKVLFDASHNVTFPGERTAVERITAGFEEYSANLTVMRYEFTQALSKTDIHDVHLRKAYDAYLKASNVLHNHITQQPLLKADGTPIFDEPSLPMCVIGGHTMQPREWALGSIETNVDCLSGINKVHLDQAYDDTVGFLGESAFLVGMGCLLFCLLLLFTAGRMVRMTHRIINIGLTLAVVVAVIYSVAVVDLFSTLSGRHGAYGQLVKDDYDSVYYAAQLQRDGTNANADESRWLIALEFNDQSSINRWQADWQTNTQRVQSLIQHAQDNRTWPEEDQPLADIHANWQSYFGLDDRIRSTANNPANPRHLLDAEQLSTGDSNRKFSSFFDAVGRLSAANQQHFDATDASTQQSLGFYLLLSALLFPLLGLLAVWGISRRLPDF